MKAKDLRHEPPRSPHYRIHDYVILARTIDKCRAELNGTAGEYHFNCPLDQKLFEFKGINADEFKAFVQTGADDDAIGQWMDQHGHVRTAGGISVWSAGMDATYPYDDSARREWFTEQCRPLALDPRKTTLFGYLEADDRASFPGFQPTSPDEHNWDLPLVETGARKRDPSIRASLH